jgi:hypothetical protein
MADLKKENIDLEDDLFEDEEGENSIESILAAEMAKQEADENEEVAEEEVEVATEEVAEEEVAEGEAAVVTPTETKYPAHCQQY